MTRSSETPWLREMVDENVEDLFSQNRRTVQRTVQRLLDRLPDDTEIADDLLEALQLSLEHRNDDTEGTLRVALLLGRGGVEAAVGPLLEALAAEDEEELQLAAGAAILYLGEPAVRQVLESLEEDPSAALSIAAYEVLGHAGRFHDDLLREQVSEFLRERLQADVHRDRSEELLERCSMALARLGQRDAIDELKACSRDNAVVADAIAWLEENEEGVVFAPETVPGTEEHAWIFDFAPEPTRARAEEQEVDPTDIADIDRLYRGLAGPGTDGEGSEEEGDD